MSKWLIEKDRRDGLIYDVAIKQYSSAFWQTLSGTPSIASNNIQANNATYASIGLYEYPDVEFALTVPVAPTAGQDKIFGLMAPTPTNWSAAYFQITGSTFQVVVKGTHGDSQNVAIAWQAGWTATQVRYRIRIENGHAQFLINETVVATFKDTLVLPTDPMPLYVHNGNADNLNLAYLGVRTAAGIV